MDNSIIRSKRDFPSVEILASDEVIIGVSANLARPLVVEIIRSVIDAAKEKLGTDFNQISYESLRNQIISGIDRFARKKISRVINGTGILVHTNLGRAPLSEVLFDKIKEHTIGYGNLEFDVNSGKRGQRGELAEKYLALASDAESGTIVNNNAAALFLILNTLANRRKVLISRGELVQIGGGFRIPDIIRKSGARLVEVGTSNITTVSDYENGLAENPALILKVHKSNFAVTGFIEEVELKALVDLGRKNSVPVINDLGSGVLIDTSELAGLREPSVMNSVHDGVALTCFSGDKLLGGVQAGMLVGETDLIRAIKKNPIYRTMRVDKITFSVIEELLGYYLNNSWKENIKLWRLASISESELYQKGQRLLKEIGGGGKVSLEGSKAEMGGGALPGVQLPSVALVFKGRLSPQRIAALFREAVPPVIGRVADDRFMIDLKALDENDAAALATIIKELIDKI